MSNTHLIHAFQPDALGQCDAVALAEQIRRGHVSVKEVTEAAIARAEQVNPALNAIALRTYDQARAWAAPAPGGATHAQGAFAGVPTFIKDNVDLAGHPTQQGTRIFKAAKARRHDPFTAQMLAQGFNVIGKSTLPEFAFNGSTEYQDGTATANPWHTGHSAGGSSGGAAALVAAGVVPMAHGNDGGGSIRIPAAACGLVGLKVSRQRFVNSNQSRTLPLNLISEGVLSRTVRDTAVFLAEAEKTFYNRRYPRVGLIEGPAARRLRIGLLLSAAGDVPIDADTQAAVLHTARLLEGAGHTVVPIQARMQQEHIDGFLLYWGFLSFGVGRFGRLLFKGTDWDMSQYQGLSLELMRIFQRRWHRIPSAVMALRSFAQLNETHFAPFDAVLSPVVTQVSPPLGYLSPRCPPEQLLPRLTGYVGFTPMQNVLGTPAISLPMGMSSTDRRPIGVQLAAQAGQEATLLSLALELEAQVAFPQINRREQA
ncbi:MAG TPA: amidase [Aquabacterium sp.]|uniref:amidase n=1 Tax=Aquabacterium sp. TaxID=1872578 RepID=UPI002E34C907|nr:amidase [Aquabacterium sp.]HEX5371602.1 amidase [Aquabacterium sp.]